MISTVHLHFYCGLNIITLLPPNTDVKRMGKNKNNQTKPENHKPKQTLTTQYKADILTTLRQRKSCKWIDTPIETKTVLTETKLQAHCECEFRFPGQYGQSPICRINTDMTAHLLGQLVFSAGVLDVDPRNACFFSLLL